jgi:hexosaminidase
VKWPDTFCPSNPKSYELLFEVFDEYINVLKPRMVHIGHDELFIPVDLCPLCKNKDIGERYGEDVRKTRDYLAGRGVRMAMWGDMLLEGVRGKGLLSRSRRPDPRAGTEAHPERHPDLQLVLGRRQRLRAT